MTAAAPIPVPTETLCLCGHPLQRHDRIAARYCEATIAGALQRNCICPPAATMAAQ
jgi:hypothetical protein